MNIDTNTAMRVTGMNFRIIHDGLLVDSNHYDLRNTPYDFSEYRQMDNHDGWLGEVVEVINHTRGELLIARIYKSTFFRQKAQYAPFIISYANNLASYFQILSFTPIYRFT